MIVVAWSGDDSVGPGTIVALDGATGTEHFRIAYVPRELEISW